MKAATSAMTARVVAPELPPGRHRLTVQLREKRGSLLHQEHVRLQGPGAAP